MTIELTSEESRVVRAALDMCWKDADAFRMLADPNTALERFYLQRQQLIEGIQERLK